MGQLFAVEVIYRGVFQKTLAKNITRGIVLAAHNQGKQGISFGPSRPSRPRALIGSGQTLVGQGPCATV